MKFVTAALLATVATCVAACARSATSWTATRISSNTTGTAPRLPE
jgi:hypothetical protein